VSDRSTAGGGESRPRAEDATLVRHEEELSVDKSWRGVGSIRARREVEPEKVRERYARDRDTLVQERVPAADDDSGRIETLPDGSISIPIFEEELVVTKRTVLRERVIIRKEQVTEWETVEAELRREHVAFDVKDAPEGSLQDTDEQ
jgi:uncharacterized protein (TIGR02271 family)